MAAIQSLGELQSIRPGWMPGVRRQSLRFYDTFNYEYDTIYRMQPNVRTCVDFLARNIAQLGLHVFKRVSDTDRERLHEHGLAMMLGMPLPAFAKVTRYKLINSLMSDLGIYFNAYWLKLRTPASAGAGGASEGGGQVSGLLRLPPSYVQVEGGLIPKKYRLTAGRTYEFGPEDVVHFCGYNPENPIGGLSPLETLRRVLAEEHAAGAYREKFWQNAARMYGIIQRPATAPEWGEPARNRFMQEFEALYAGDENSGKTAVLEDGMEWVATSFNPQQSEYLAGRKLTREECARAYHIPLPMVGILDNATFSNISEQHKNLYQDSLGPWLAMIEQDIKLQLLPEFEDTGKVYVEFNIQAKLAGSFEEQTKSLQSAVGRPWMTANEARARMNLPKLGGDADQIVTPLNVIAGGQASPQDSAPKRRLGSRGSKDKDLFARKQSVRQAQDRFDSNSGELRGRHEQKWVEILARHYRRQEAAIVSRVPETLRNSASSNRGKGDHKGSPLRGGKAMIGEIWFDEDRWDAELQTDLFRLNNLTAMAWAEEMMAKTGATIEDMDTFEGRMLHWLEEHSRVQAEYINGRTMAELETALRDPEALEAVKTLFGTAVTVWAVSQAVTGVTAAANFGAHEAAGAGGLGEKTWRVNSNNPRPAHSAINGETVGIREKFSNGGRWPGDPALGADDNANCMCSVEFS